VLATFAVAQLDLLSQSWFNLDAAWAFSLIFVGALSLAIIMTIGH
jgi:hypothetical protein